MWPKKFLKIRQIKPFLATTGCILLFALLPAQMAFSTGEVSLVGMVTEQGIVTYDGQLYSIVENNMGKEVMRLINRKVEVIGKIIERSDGKKSIDISNYGISE